MNQAEKTFQERGEAIAKQLDRLAQDVRRKMSSDHIATERAGDIFHVVHWGLANMHFETFFKRAVLADKERDSDKIQQ